MSDNEKNFAQDVKDHLNDLMFKIECHIFASKFNSELVEQLRSDYIK